MNHSKTGLFLTISMFFSSGGIYALAATSGTTPASRDEICSVADPALVHSKDIPLVPEFFFRPFPKSNVVAVASDSQNYFVNLSTGSAVKVPGNYDALPLPDEKFWIYPDGTALHFQKLGSGGKDDGPVFTDPKMQGYYQSAGMVEKPGGGTRYRVMIDHSDGTNGEFSFQDYDPTPDGKINPVNANPKPLCANLKGPHSLPMLSKDGKEIALLDVNAGHTNIYKINSLTGNCTIDKQLFQATGKVDFSFDNQSITYHTIEKMDAAGVSQHGMWFNTPSAKMVANVWSMDLKTGTTKQISHFTETSALYPAFNANGDILVRKFKANGGSTILTYDPKKEPRSIDPKLFGASSSQSCEDATKFNAVVSLGQLFADLCLPNTAGFSAQSKALFVMNLDKNSCHRLVQSWGMNKDKVVAELNASHSKDIDMATVSKLDVDTLLQSCPQEDIGGQHSAIPLNEMNLPPPDLTKVPAAMNRCLTCHGPNSALPMPFNDVTALKKLLLGPSKTSPSETLIDEMSNRVGARSVPPANNLGAKSLTDDETNTVLNWLNGVKNEPQQ